MTANSTDKIPGRAECEELMARFSMLPHIVEHSRQVMRVALAVTDHLKTGVSVNRELVMAASLLHDITKTRSLKTHEKHAASGGELLRDLGFSSVAEIVEQHVIIRDLNPGGGIEEKEIVYYADKRVMHDTIVSIEERVQDLMVRYGTTEEIREQIFRNREQMLAVEQKIAGLMKVTMHHALQTII
ncbi:MAG: HD domain-containing protein [Smithella sp.]